MKKIIAFLILLLCVKQSYAQYPLKQYLGSDSTLVTVRGGMNARLVLWSFTDTTQANTQRINQYAGALIYTTGTDKVWYRNSTATGWIEFTSSGGSTVNIYNSDGDLTGERQLGGNGYNLRFNDIREFGIGTDSLSVVLNYPKYKITGLSQTTDTTTYKPLAIDADGYFTIMDRWPGGGGSSGWALTGNAGTDTATNFIGTTDSVGFRIRINNQPFGFFSEYSFGSLKLGYQALFKEPQNVLTRNIAIGREAMYNNLSGGIDNIAIGWKALYANTTGSNNIGIGIASLVNNTTGSYNTVLSQSLYYNTTGSANTALGFNSMNNNTTGSFNIGVGYNSLYSNTTANYNTAVGVTSLYANTTGAYNSALGFQSMRYNTTGEQNSAFGANSLYRNTTGIKNSALGAGALENNTSGQENTAVGQDALLANTTGIRNIGIGWNGFANNFTGGQNVGIGYGAGKTITNGNNNTILGAFAAWDAAQNDTITGAVIIGHSATASEDSTVVLGNDYIKKTHLKGVVYVPFTTGDATTSDSALVVDRSTGALIMRPVAGGGTYTFTNGLTESGGTVKLGGALTQNTSLTNPSGYDLKLYVDEDDSFVGLVGINYNSLIGFEAGSIMIQHGSYNYFSNDGTQLQLYGGNGNNTSFINLTDDILRIDPAYGILSIDTLAAASNMTNKRVMTWDTVTKRWEQIAKDSVGGGGSDGYLDNATFNTTTNYLTLEQTNAADVSVRIPPSYIINPINADSLTRIVNDSTLMVKAVVIADTDPVEVTTVRNDSLNTHTIAIRQTFLDSIRNGDFGGGTPGGSDTYVQFNDGGSFGGDAGLNYNKTDNELKINTATDNGAYKLQGEGGMYWKLDGTNAYKIVNSSGSDRVTVNASSGNLDAYTFSSQNFSTSTGGNSTFSGSFMRQQSGAYFQGWQQAFSMIRTYPGTGSSPQSTVIFDNTTETSPASDYQIATFKLSGTSVAFVDKDGKYNAQSTVTAGGTTGNQTINKPTGTVNIAAAGSTVTVTNSTCTANSIVYAVLRTNDATATGIKSVVPSAGSFVITLNAAATAEVSVGFIVFN